MDRDEVEVHINAKISSHLEWTKKWLSYLFIFEHWKGSRLFAKVMANQVRFSHFPVPFRQRNHRTCHTINHIIEMIDFYWLIHSMMGIKSLVLTEILRNNLPFVLIWYFRYFSVMIIFETPLLLFNGHIRVCPYLCGSVVVILCQVCWKAINVRPGLSNERGVNFAGLKFSNYVI